MTKMSPRLVQLMILEQALILLGPDGEHWGREDYETTDSEGVERYCMLGAVYAAKRITHPKDVPGIAFLCVRQLADCLPEACTHDNENFLDRPDVVIVEFNDDDENTQWEDVQQAFECAIQRLKEDDA